MSPSNANPGAGGARAHGISKNDTASPTRNQIPAQTDSAARSAMFVLSEAKKMGIAVGTDATEIVMIAPVKVPWETQKWFSTKLYEFRAEVIAIIEKGNAASKGGLVVSDAVKPEGAA
jgi:hypothetical protein